MTFFTFITSDKRGLKYFLWIIIPISIYASLLIAGNIRVLTLIGLSLVLIPTILYVGFYGSSYMNYLQQELFFDYHKGAIEQVETKKVLLFQKGFTLYSPRTNYPAKINVAPREERFNFIKIKGETVLLCFVYDLGRFKRYLKPLHLFDDNTAPLIKLAKPVEVTVRSNGNLTEVHFLHGNYAIIKLTYECPKKYKKNTYPSAFH